LKKRPPKAAQAATKGKTAPAKVRRLGGPPAAKAGASSWEEETRKRLVKKKTDATPEEIDAMLERMKAIRAEAEAKHSGQGSADGDRIAGIYKHARLEAEAKVKARAGLEQFQASDQGFDAARVELIGLEAGADVAGRIAEKHIPPASTTADQINDELARPVPSVETQGELALALEALGEWLSEVENDTGKARWRRILDPQGSIFNTKYREAAVDSAERKEINKTNGARLVAKIKKAANAALVDAEARAKALDSTETILDVIENPSAKVIFLKPIVAALEKHRSACVEFLRAFYQRNTGSRRVSIDRKSRVAEAMKTLRPDLRGDLPLLKNLTEIISDTDLKHDRDWILKRRRDS
jgi:hypothetical protein